MGDPKRTDTLVAGEELAPFTFQVTEEFNENFLHSMEDFHPRYMGGVGDAAPIIHAGLLFNFSNLTRSPSFSLSAGSGGDPHPRRGDIPPARSRRQHPDRILEDY